MPMRVRKERARRFGKVVPDCPSFADSSRFGAPNRRARRRVKAVKIANRFRLEKVRGLDFCDNLWPGDLPTGSLLEFPAKSGKRKSVGRWDPNSPRFHSRRSTLTPPPPLRNRSPVPVSPPNAESIWLPTVQTSSTPPSPIRALCSWAANPCPVPVCPFRNPPSAFRLQLSTPRPLPLFPPLASRLSTLDS